MHMYLDRQAVASCPFIVYKTEQEAGTCNEKVERVYLSSLHCSLLLFDFLVLGGGN